jgi:hypothetical protein
LLDTLGTPHARCNSIFWNVRKIAERAALAFNRNVEPRVPGAVIGPRVQLAILGSPHAGRDSIFGNTRRVLEDFVSVANRLV